MLFPPFLHQLARKIFLSAVNASVRLWVPRTKQVGAINEKESSKFDSDYNLMRSAKGQVMWSLLAKGRTEMVND
jgi:hypothetical protein